MGTRRAKTKSNYPKAPEGLEDEELLEWDRICGDLDAEGRLEKADRAFLTVYVGIWSVRQKAMRRVNLDGFEAENNNGTTGRSTAYTVLRETSAQLRRLLNDLGASPAARGGGGGSTSANSGDLEF